MAVEKHKIENSSDVQPSVSPYVEPYLSSVLEGNRSGARAVVEEAVVSGFSTQALYLEIFIPVQKRLGELWTAGEIGISDEHIATQITTEEMARLRQGFTPKTQLKFRIGIGTVAGDNHLIAARMVADFFLLDGWQVDFLGASTPAEDFAAYCLKRKPDLVGISVSLAEQLREARCLVGILKSLDSPPYVLVGGAAVWPDGDLMGADIVASHPLTALGEARALMKIPNQTVELDYYLENLGSRIQSLRRRQGLNQRDLGERAGLDRAYVSMLENGRRNVSVGVLLRIAGALDISVEELLTG